MLENVYEGLNAWPKVYLSKEYFFEMYPTCVSSKLCEFIEIDLVIKVKIVKEVKRSDGLRRFTCGDVLGGQKEAKHGPKNALMA